MAMSLNIDTTALPIFTIKKKLYVSLRFTHCEYNARLCHIPSHFTDLIIMQLG